MNIKLITFLLTKLITFDIIMVERILHGMHDIQKGVGYV